MGLDHLCIRAQRGGGVRPSEKHPIPRVAYHHDESQEQLSAVGGEYHDRTD